MIWCGFDESDFVAAGLNGQAYARLAWDEAGYSMSRSARAEQVGRREEVKVAASDN